MKTHRFDPTSLVLGLVVLAVAAAYLVGALTDVTINSAWLLPAGLIGLGVAGLLTGVSRSVRARDEVEPVEPPA